MIRRHLRNGWRSKEAPITEKLIRMLEAVNDYSKPVSTVLEQYF